MKTRVQRAKERDDVGQPLRGQYRSAITRHPALLERACDCLRSPVYLRHVRLSAGPTPSWTPSTNV